jgi:hypothetical protein
MGDGGRPSTSLVLPGMRFWGNWQYYYEVRGTVLDRAGGTAQLGEDGSGALGSVLEREGVVRGRLH